MTARVLKVGHHDSDTATGAPFVTTVDPTIAVIEAGAFNSYGHPGQAVVKRLQDGGATSRTSSRTSTR